MGGGGIKLCHLFCRWLSFFIDPHCGAKYGGGKASKNLTAHSIINCVLEMDN